MKKFLFNISLVFVISSIGLAVLDKTYTEIYGLVVPMNKFQYLRSLKDRHLNYIFVGSSRIDNTIEPSIIKKRTGKDAANLGFSGAKMCDILSLIRFLKAYNVTCDTLFVQVDYAYNHLENSGLIEHQVMPFMHETNVAPKYSAFIRDHWALIHIPFYRFARYDHVIGLREMVRFARNKKSKLAQRHGFTPLFKQRMFPDYVLPDTLRKQNVYFDTIKAVAKREKIPLVLFCSPFSGTVQKKEFFKKLKAKIPELHDFSQVIPTDSLFYNQSHLNSNGAAVFTNIVIDSLLLRQNGHVSPAKKKSAN